MLRLALTCVCVKRSHVCALCVHCVRRRRRQRIAGAMNINMNSLVASQKKDLTKGGDFNAAVSPTIHVSDIATFAVQYSKDELNNNPGTIPCTVCACFPHKSGVDRSACIFLAACFLAVQLCANADVPAASHSLVPTTEFVVADMDVVVQVKDTFKTVVVPDVVDRRGYAMNAFKWDATSGTWVAVCA